MASVFSTIRSDKLQEDFTCRSGITPTQVKTLIAYTQNEQDPAVHESTADWQGGSGRFASRSNFDKWHAQGRYIYTLLDGQHHLAGVIWFGSKAMPGGNSDYGITFAIRLYGRARGAGLSIPFTQIALAHFRTTKSLIDQHSQGIWLETSQNNLGAVKTYQKLGCIQIGPGVEDGRIVMVFPDKV